ncbi:SMC proteins flexible hinge domain-containing protein [Ditylenchus destructor]|uniref:Structural maintenance of chromosomes protein n=1 Tax=Ditylenchus destructor TaxID=166010 RepID=A0AAD4MYA2_9BILA|nr:SMC proteins flexible hinge domain-containing protein [Ditylenchus destructor]
MPVPAGRKIGKPAYKSKITAAAEQNDENQENLLKMEIPPPPERMAGSAKGPKGRLIISKVDVENFKSYYGKQTIGPFHKNFTSIIGPNGSGKSNVIDALLFVFGYRAAKIRSKKLSTLIHSSAGKDDIDSCTVRVYFERIIDISRHEVTRIPNSEFHVSRTAYRDGSSKYVHNGRTMQFKEITDILRKSGIDLVHSRFLILQGEVEQISMMKPKAENENEEGILEYLEDIIGSSRLKLPINKFRYKLEKIQEQRAAQLQRLKYADKEKVSCEGPAKDVIAAIYLDNAINILRNKVLSVKRLEVTDKIAPHDSELKEVEAEADTAKERVKELALQISQLKNQKKESENALEELQRNLEKTKADVRTEDQEASTASSNLDRLKKKKTKICSDIKKAETQIETLLSAPEIAEREIETQTKILNESEDVIQKMREIIEQKLPLVQEKTATLQKRIGEVATELSERTVTENDLSSKVVIAQDELNNLESAEENQRRLLAELNEKLEDSRQKFLTKNGEYDEAQRKLPGLKDDLESIEKELFTLRQNESVTSNRVRELTNEIEHIRQTAEKYRTSNRQLSALMKQKHEGHIPGIYGRLGDLGAIEEKYDVAVSTTCGLLDYIVVDTVETAQVCIEYLKKESLGIASFIALDKQNFGIKDIRNKPKTPGDALRLIDLIQVNDEKVLPAFFFALGNTLIADTIDAASRIAYQPGKTWRTVTLKGEVIEPTGAMTGGGNEQRKGRIGQSVKVDTSKSSDDSARNVAQLSKQLDESKSRLTEIRRKLEIMENDKRRKQTMFTDLEKTTNNLKLDKENLEKAIALLEPQVEEQTRKMTELSVDPVVLENTSKKVKQLKAELDKVTVVTDSLRMENMSLTEKLESTTKEIMGTEQQRLKEAETSKKDAEKRIAKEKNVISSNTRNLTKAQRTKSDLEADLAQLEQDQARLQEEQIGRESRVEELKASVTQLEEEIKTTDSAYKEKQAKQLQEKRRAIEDRVKDLRHKAASISKEISKLSLFDFNEIRHLPAELHKSDRVDDFIVSILNSVEEYNARRSNVLRVEAMETDEPENNANNSNDNLDEAMDVDEDIPEPVHSMTLPSGRRSMLRRNAVPRYTDEILRDFEKEELEAQLAEVERRKNKEHAINMGTLRDYMEKVDRYNSESELYKAISEQRDLHRDLCDRLKKQRLREFMEGFETIGIALKEMYQMMTLGGDASLDLIDSLDPFSDGISFGVRPPKKSWKQIGNLSGGEKTLASLSFVFALHQFCPTPFYVMDEIDAALDYRNERTEDAQFIVISLRNNMFEKGDRIVGVYKVSDCTSHVVLDNDKRKLLEAV